METGEIPDGALSDSTGSSASAVNARLNKNVGDFPFGWAPPNTDPTIQHWIQADLGSVHKVAIIAYHITSHHIISCHINHIISYQIISDQIISYHIISYQSYHIRSYHIM